MAAVADVPELFNAALHFVDRNVDLGRGAKIAIECGDERLSYGDVRANVNRCANALVSLGLGLEQRVTVLLPDCPEFVYCFFGAMKLGAVAVPTNTPAQAQRLPVHARGQPRPHARGLDVVMARRRADPQGSPPSQRHRRRG